MYDRKIRKKRMHWKTVVFLVCMMFIPVVFSVIYDLYLKAATIKLMFSNQYATGFGFYWVKWAFTEAVTPGSQTFIAIKNIFVICIVFNCLGLPLQIIISYFFMKKVPGTRLFRTLFYMPTLFSAVITSLVFGFMFDNTVGPLVPILKQLGFTIPDRGLFFDSETALPMIFVYMFWLTVGCAAYMLTAAMMKTPDSVLEAGRLDGVTNFQELIHIVIPMVSPTLSVLVLSNVMAGFSIYAEILLLTKPDQSETYTVAYLITESAKNGRYTESAGRGFIFTLIAIPMCLGVRRFFDKVLPDVTF